MRLGMGAIALAWALLGIAVIAWMFTYIPLQMRCDLDARKAGTAGVYSFTSGCEWLNANNEWEPTPAVKADTRQD